MATKEVVIRNFAEQTGKFKNGSRCNGGGWGGGGSGGYNIFYEDRILYSYGHHFPLAIRHEDAGVENAVGFGAGVQYIINGDKYSVSTTSHQNECIRELKENVQIPFSALQEAWNWAQAKHIGYAKVEARRVELRARMRDITAVDSWEDREREYDEYCASAEYRDKELKWRMNRVTRSSELATALKRGDGGFQVVAWNKDEWSYRGVDKDDKPLTKWMVSGSPEWEEHCHVADCGCATHPSQHRLGAVLFKIREHSFLSSFDELDRRNYFLCHVPGSPGTVEEALEMLKPMEIKLCEKAGATILRQGDWFFYQASEPAAELAKWLKQQAKTEIKQYRLGGTTGTHTVTRMRRESPGHAMLLVSGTVRHSPTDGRSPEHKRLKLGDGKSWWIPVKNTSEAGWGAVGNVD